MATRGAMATEGSSRSKNPGISKQGLVQGVFSFRQEQTEREEPLGDRVERPWGLLDRRTFSTLSWPGSIAMTVTSTPR